MLNRSINLTGQWTGYFVYGPEYGRDIHGEKVQFRLFIDRCVNGEFNGRSVDEEGVGANYEVAQVKGFLDENFISFTKQYPYYYALDDVGNAVEDKNKQHPLVVYTGEYNWATKTYSGTWELTMDIKSVGDYWLEDICTGSWEMRKDE